jgi:hypothetical protein
LCTQERKLANEILRRGIDQNVSRIALAAVSSHSSSVHAQVQQVHEGNPDEIIPGQPLAPRTDGSNRPRVYYDCVPLQYSHASTEVKNAHRVRLVAERLDAKESGDAKNSADAKKSAADSRWDSESLRVRVIDVPPQCRQLKQKDKRYSSLGTLAAEFRSALDPGSKVPILKFRLLSLLNLR